MRGSGCGIFGAVGGIPQVSWAANRRVLQMRRISGHGVIAPLAWLLPQPDVSLNVLRAAVSLIALTIAAGPNADLLCGIWCHPVDETALTCLHQETTTPQATSSDTCNEATLRAIAFIREDVRRAPTVPDAANGAVIPRFAFVPSTGDHRWSNVPAGGLVLEARFPTRPLRI